LKADDLRIRLSPKWETRLPKGLDPCLPRDVLRVFRLATQGVVLNNDPKTGALPGASAENTAFVTADDFGNTPQEGSNAWVIAPRRTTTGRAILASDPHRAYSVPSLRYIAHLNAPGLNVIGAGEPALPGISIGHNGTIAFGLTIFGIDQEDLYVYELNPTNPRQYRHLNRWEDFVVRREVIDVKDRESVTVEQLYGRHGPVIYTEPIKNRAFVVRTAWLEPGMAPYFGSVNYMYAKNFHQFKAAMQHWGAPAENQVYADVQGNIGWVPGGMAPIRPDWDGLLPVPGDGRYEWSGFWSGEHLPGSYNPEQGWFASANEMNLPGGYPYEKFKLGFEWPSDDRHTRLREVLSRPGKQSIEDSMALQNDVLSVPARRVIGLLKPLHSPDPRIQAALDLLKGWNFSVGADSSPGALFEIWWSRYLGSAFKEAVLDQKSALVIGSVDTAVLLDGLEQPETAFNTDPIARRNAVLLSSLGRAWANAEQLLGPDSKQWQWGKLHHTLIEHPFGAAVDDATRTLLNVGPLSKHGGGATPNLSSYDPRTFRQTGGPSFRIVVDVGNWDNSRAINTPGQSGERHSPHYRDLTEMWRNGDYFPLLYSRQAVQSQTRHHITLEPVRAAKRAALKAASAGSGGR
jgi:penicillin amidase